MAWIGAWWLGFLIFGGVSVMIGVIMLGFPERLPGKYCSFAKFTVDFVLNVKH